MSFAMIWPIGLIVLSNIFYHICSKQTPNDIHPLAALTVTYAIGAVFSAVLYYVLERGGNLLREYHHMNWTTVVLGLAIVGLEVGCIFMYRNGWDISVGQLTHSTILSICLLLIGCLVYGENITPSRIAGMLLCLVGLYFISR